jgi:hypothetical protein
LYSFDARYKINKELMAKEKDDGARMLESDFVKD